MRWKKILWKVAVVSLLVGVVFYNLRLAPVPATSHVVSRATVTEEVLGTGTLEARVRATVSSKISGRILQLLVDQGDRVQAGQLLMTLEDDELQQQVAIAEANVEAVQAAIERLETDKQRALAVAEQAQRSFERVEQLLRQKAVSQEEGDKALEALSVARAGLSLSEAAINEAHKEKISAIKSLEYQRARLSDTRITAPFEGMIVRREREPGDIVVPGTQVLSLISLNELWISAWVDETAMSRVQVGQPARVVFRAVPDQV
ncbi:MAG: efflux RND transporter periplasmic adaptor subunit, partial [Planctomycetales bacterium]|nr:efflux RND transporter periplasmic adaptor subunit [Planctomycetales bacterium]